MLNALLVCLHTKMKLETHTEINIRLRERILSTDQVMNVEKIEMDQFFGGLEDDVTYIKCKFLSICGRT